MCDRPRRGLRCIREHKRAAIIERQDRGGVRVERQGRFPSRRYVIGALVCFVVAAVAAAFIGRYWFMLSQAGFAAAMGLILAGAEGKRGVVWPVLFWGALAVGVLAVLAEGLV